MNFHLKDVVGVELSADESEMTPEGTLTPYMTHIAALHPKHRDWRHKLGHV